jgi:hypothetical protein
MHGDGLPGDDTHSVALSKKWAFECRACFAARIERVEELKQYEGREAICD